MASPYRQQMSITTALIISNVIVFVMGNVSGVPAYFGIEYPSSPYTESLLFVRGAYSWLSCFMEGEIWRLFTYQFLHAGPMHLLFNMWALYFFGRAVEDAMGPRRYLAFYLACGVAGALFSSLLAGLGIYGETANSAEQYVLAELGNYLGHADLRLWEVVPMVGASAAIYGVLVAVAFLYPHSLVRLVFPPITMSLRSFALTVLVFAVLIVVFNGDNAGGEAGHLGGILLSAIIMSVWRYRYLKRRRDEGRF